MSHSATAKSISNYLTFGMHHSTPEGRAAIADIISERDDVQELALCEAGRIMLRPGVRYRFTVRPGCEACAKAAEPYQDESNMTNREIGTHLLQFTLREEALQARAKAVGVDYDADIYRSWQHWFGDSANYLNHLKNAVEAAEAKLK